MIFQTQLLSFTINSLGYGPYFIIPKEIAIKLLSKTKDKRVTCILNSKISIDRAITLKDNFYYILMNKEIMKQINIGFGDEINVELIPNISKYGIDICEELEEVLFQDPEGSKLFHLLTPGKQRSLIFYINKIKSSQLRIERSFVIMEHLRNYQGKLDEKQLREDFKIFKNKFK